MTRNRDDMIKSKFQKIRHLVKRRLWLDQLGDQLGDRTGKRHPAKTTPTCCWKYVFPRAAVKFWAAFSVIASGTHWRESLLLISSITRHGFKLIVTLSTRQICQWSFTIVSKRVCCGLRRHLQWVLTMLATIANSFKPSCRQAGHDFEEDNT